MIDDLMMWEDSCSEDDLCLSLKGVTLKVPMGKFPAGTTFIDAMVDFDQGVLTLGTDDDDYAFSMEISIGREI